jgi:3-methyladenine DNA glycosylase AlkD
MVELLQSPWHEARLLALILMVHACRKGDAATGRAVLDAWLANGDRVNSWDLVDVSAGPILGPHLHGGRNERLTRLARSASVWERRIAIVATSQRIRQDEFDETLRIARLLLDDSHDLIHKAVGWMLREVMKRDRAAAERFLRRHCRTMPRTMLRYAIEKFPPASRAAWLAGRPEEA